MAQVRLGVLDTKRNLDKEVHLAQIEMTNQRMKMLMGFEKCSSRVGEYHL